MKIIKASTEDRKVIYQLTQGAGIEKLSSHAGEDFKIKDFVVYDDAKQDGSSARILSLESETGAIIATNSATVLRSFANIEEICGNMTGETVRIISGTSKAGRTYYDLAWI